MGKGAETRQAVLAEATEIAARLGLSGLTIGTLANSAGLSKSGLYAHFGSKEQLQLATLRHARDFFVDQVLRPSLSAPRGEPRLREFFTRWLDCCRTDSAAGCLYMSSKPEFDDRPGAVRDQLVTDYRDLLDSIIQIVTAGVTDGRFRADVDPAQVAQDLDGIVLAYFVAYRLLREPAIERRAQRAFDTLLTSIRADCPSEGPHTSP